MSLSKVYLGLFFLDVMMVAVMKQLMIISAVVGLGLDPNFIILSYPDTKLEFWLRFQIIHTRRLPRLSELISY